MKHFWMMLSLLATVLFLPAQIQIGIEIDRDQYLQYEPLPVKLTVMNNSGSPLNLSGDWLGFLVTELAGSGVRKDNKMTIPPLQLESGSRKTITINITPLYSIREVGQYQIQGVVEVDGVQYVSKTLAVNIANGTKVWSDSRPIQGVQRIYSLLRFSPDDRSSLIFLRVEEPSENKVYATYNLGSVVSFIPPETKFDAQGNLHILHPKGSGIYRYTRVTATGKLENQADYRSGSNGKPALQSGTEGLVLVQGGQTMEGEAKRERLSQGQNVLTTKGNVPVVSEKEASQ